MISVQTVLAIMDISAVVKVGEEVPAAASSRGPIPPFLARTYISTDMETKHQGGRSRTLYKSAVLLLLVGKHLPLKCSTLWESCSCCFYSRRSQKGAQVSLTKAEGKSWGEKL